MPALTQAHNLHVWSLLHETRKAPSSAQHKEVTIPKCPVRNGAATHRQGRLKDCIKGAVRLVYSMDLAATADADEDDDGSSVSVSVSPKGREEEESSWKQ